MGEIGRVSIGVDGDTTGLEGDIKRGTLIAAERAEGSPEFDHAAKSLGEGFGGKAGSSAMDKFGNEIIKDANGRWREKLTGKFADLGDEMGTKLGNSIGDSNEKTISKRVSNLGKVILPNWLRTIGFWVAALAPAALQLAAVILPAVGIVAAIIPAALGATAAIGVLRASVAGVGGAIKAIGGPTAAYNAALAKLAPAARSFVQEVAKAKPALHDLQQGLQNAFFGQLTGVVTNLANVLLPKIHNSLISIATDIGSFGANLGKTLSSSANATKLSSIFEEFGSAIFKAGKAIGPLVDGLLTIGHDAAPMLGRAADAFGRFAGWFDRVITSASNSGKLTTFFNTAVTALDTIGTLGKDAYRVVADLLGAAAKAGGGGAVVGVFNTIADVFDRLNKDGALVAVFKIINQAFSVLGQVIGPLIEPLSKLVLALGKDLSDDLTRLTPGLVNLVNNGLVPLLGAALAVLPALMPIVTVMVELVNALASNSALVITVLSALTAWFIFVKAQQLAAAIAEIVVQFTSWIAAAIGLDVALDANPIGAVVLAIEALIVTVAAIIYLFNKFDIWSKIWDALKTTGEAIGHFFEGIGSAVADFFTVTLPGYWDSFVNFLEGIPGFLVDFFIGMAKDTLEGIGIAIGLALAAIIEGPKLAFKALQLWFRLFIAFWTQLVPAVINAVIDFGPKLIAIFVRAAGTVLRNVRSWGKDLMKAWLAPITYAIDHWNSWMSFLRSVPGKIIGLVPKMLGAGLALIKGFFKGLGGAGASVGDLASHIVSSIKGALNGAINQINKGINKVGGIIHINLPNIPTFASGGIVSGPTLLIAGERNPEVILPTDNPRRAAQLLRQSGLEQSLGMGAPNVNVVVKIGERELTDIVSTEVSAANEETAMALSHGTRG